MPFHRLILALIATVSVVACSEATNGTGQISKRIGEVVHDPAAREVDIAKLTTFGWDEFYIFKPGTSRAEICEFIGAKRNSCGRIIRYQAVPNDSMAFAFGLNKQLTHTELHALSNGRFESNAGGKAYTRSASVFKIQRSSTGTSNDEVRLEQP